MENILLLGLGHTNRYVIKFLIAKNYQANYYVVSDEFSEEDKSFLDDLSFSYFNPEAFIKLNIRPDIIIKAPGVFLDHPLLNLFANTPVINDIEIMYQVLKDSDVKLIGITGTNGKTSTTLLLDKVLNQAGYNSYYCGNIGVSPLKILMEHDLNTIDFLVLELSSFQLHNIIDFSCDISLILNIAPDHLNYHHTFGDYVNAKLNIIKNLTRTQLIVSGYSHLPTTFPVVYIKEGMNNYNNSISPMNVSIIRSVLEFLDIDQQILTSILVNHQFILPHRMEYVDCINGITFINDSKATNVGATINALEQFKNVILLVGGSSKDEDMHPLGGFLDNVKQVIAYGANKLDFGFIPGIIMVNTLNEAVNIAYKLSSPDDVVLLSPASASLDQFSDYKQRGDKFKILVEKIKE